MKIQICSCRTALCEHIFFEITHTQRNKLDENWILYLYGKWRNCVMAEKKALENEEIKEYGQIELNENRQQHNIQLLSIIGEVEGHECLASNTKTTKYEHVLPKLALIEDDEEIEGLLILLNTVGGDVEAGLAIAEMIASLSIPTVSLVLGGGHSHGGISRLFLYRAKCYHGGPSGASERNVYWRGAVLPQYGKNPGPDHCLCIRTFTYHGRTDGGADAGYLPACKRCRDYAGRGGSGKGRAHR